MSVVEKAAVRVDMKAFQTAEIWVDSMDVSRAVMTAVLSVERKGILPSLDSSWGSLRVWLLESVLGSAWARVWAPGSV